MAIFANGVATQTSAPGTSATAVFNPNSTALAALSPAVALHDVTIINTGSVNVALGSSTVTATTGLILKPGQQLTIQGWLATSGNAAGEIYGIVASGTGACEAGLSSFPSVV